MAHKRVYVALDIGGSGGRAITGKFDGKTLSLQQAGEFSNTYVSIHSGIYWDILNLFNGIKKTLGKIRQRDGSAPVSIGVDTMGVNFALLDKKGHLIGNPCYTRVPQKKKVLDIIFNRIPQDMLFQTTGLQLTKLNSLYHLVEMHESGSPSLDIAHNFLMLPDLINFWLTGRVVSEYTIASTSHLLNCRTREWATDLLEKATLPTHIFPDLISAGNVIDKLHPTVATETGLRDALVVATASHDTAAAFAATPVATDNWACFSSGTWGMLGCELSEPILSNRARSCNFAN